MERHLQYTGAAIQASQLHGQFVEIGTIAWLFDRTIVCRIFSFRLRNLHVLYVFLVQMCLNVY